MLQLEVCLAGYVILQSPTNNARDKAKINLIEPKHILFFIIADFVEDWKLVRVCPMVTHAVLQFSTRFVGRNWSTLTTKVITTAGSN